MSCPLRAELRVKEGTMKNLLISAALSFSFTLTACAGATETTVGPQGEVIRIAEGLTLSVPAGALPADQRLTVRDLSFGNGEHELEFEPAGVVLSSPATLTLVDDDGVELEAAEGLEIEHAETHSTARFTTLGHVSIRAPGREASHAKKRCKWVMVSSDPATGSSTWVCVVARP